MKFVDIMFGPYLPDLGGAPNPEAPGYLVDALNVRSTPRGYRGQPTFATFGATAPGSGTDVGTAAMFTYATFQDWFVITNTNTVYQSKDAGANWTDVTPTTGYVPFPRSEFVAFDDQIILSYCFFGGAVRLQEKRLSDSVSVDFGALTGSPSGLGRYLARVRDHVVLGSGAYATSDEFLVRWSAIGNPEDWPTPGSADARSKQAGQQIMPLALGRIRKILGGEKFGIVVQENGLTRMTYVGGSNVYEFDTYEKKNGAGYEAGGASGGPVPFVQIGPNLWAWINETGAYATDGYSVRSLSAGILDEALFVDSTNDPYGPFSKPGRCAYDARRKQAIWSLPGGSSHICFNTETGQFTLLNGTSYNVLFDGPNSASDTTPYVYDFGADRILRRLSGNGGNTIGLQTGYIELEPGHRVQIQKAHLLGAGVPGSLSLSYKTAATLSSVDASQSGFTSMTALGRSEGASARVDAPYIAFRVTGTLTEEKLVRGIRIFYERTSPL